MSEVTGGRKMHDSDASTAASVFQWLVERGQPEGEPNAVWLEHSAYHNAAERRWTTNANEAAMFPDRQTCEAYIADEGLEARAVEHGFMYRESHEDEIARALEQACRDLQQAHNEILRVQGCPEAEWVNRDWPKWTPQANTIRWAEKLLGKPLGKRGQQP